jgi:hypothetical protein
MKNKTIVISHDTGNTTVILNSINTLLAKDNNQEVIFLIVGEAAQSIFSQPANESHKDRVIYLNDWLTEPLRKRLDDKTLSDDEIAQIKEEIAALTLKSLTARPLSADELAIVKEKIEEFNPDKAIATSSCFPTALVPYQISELLTEYLALENNFIYNGDFLQDLLNNPFWVSIKGEWATHVSLLVAMAREQALVKELNEQLTCHVVGSSAIDKLYDTQVTADEIKQIKEKLNAQDQYLLFISGSKTILEDLELLQALDSGMIVNDKIALRMGVHPGTQDMQTYVSELVGWLKIRADSDLFPVKLVISPAVRKKLTDPSILDPEYVCEVDLKGDDIFPAADAVASAQPTTIATQAIISGKLAYHLPRFTNSYLPTFFKQLPADLINTNHVGAKLTKGEVGLPDARAVEVISAKLLEQHANRRRP